MANTTFSETSYRAVWLWDGAFGATALESRQTEDEAWADADRLGTDHFDPAYPGRWIVRQTTTTTTSTEIERPR